MQLRYLSSGGSGSDFLQHVLHITQASAAQGVWEDKTVMFVGFFFFKRAMSRHCPKSFTRPASKRRKLWRHKILYPFANALRIHRLGVKALSRTH
jgi:hypothetical protein